MSCGVQASLFDAALVRVAPWAEAHGYLQAVALRRRRWRMAGRENSGFAWNQAARSCDWICEDATAVWTTGFQSGFVRLMQNRLLAMGANDLFQASSTMFAQTRVRLDQLGTEGTRLLFPSHEKRDENPERPEQNPKQESSATGTLVRADHCGDDSA